MNGTLIAVCVSDKRGQKQTVSRGTMLIGHGLAGDAHAGTWHRQISLLEEEKIDQMRAKGLELPAGSFGENLVTRHLDLRALNVGQRVRVGVDAVLELTQRGKECHTRCPIYYAAGDCIMPTEGVFARVLRGGEVAAGDTIVADGELDGLRAAVVTLSDRSVAKKRVDESGPLVADSLHEHLGAQIVATSVLADERSALEAELCRLCDEELCDLVITTGGTGLSPRDVTPEATLAVAHREVPGMAEAMRRVGCEKTPRAMLSRGVVVQRNRTLIVNLSGSPRAADEQLQVILPVLNHALETASGRPMDCAVQPDSKD